MNQLIHLRQEKLNALDAELAAAMAALNAAERALAEEQAAVNAFRMYCRLTIGTWVNALFDLRSEKQALLTRLRLARQALGLPEPDVNRFEQTAVSDDMPPEAEQPHYESVMEMVASFARDYAAEKRLYRELARRFHPDLAKDGPERAYATAMMSAVNVAYEQGDVQTLRELAGEHDPTAVAELEQETDTAVRQKKKKLMACQRRHRKVAQQLRAHHQDYTTQLWLKASQVKADEEQNWWDEIQQVLEREIAGLEKTVATLQGEVTELEAVLAEQEADETVS